MKLVAENIARRYLRASADANYFEAVHPADLTLQSGEMVVLTGRSGSGKTTLLTMMAGLLTPSSGTVSLDGRDLYGLPDRELSALRTRHFAVIPQGTSAISSLTVMENVLFPAVLGKKKPPADQAEMLMKRLDILNLCNAWPEELSGGELRRMAITSALAGNPDFVFADEPTADLDEENTKVVLQLLRETADCGAAVFVVTHETEATAFAHRLLRMSAGALAEGLS